MKQSICESNWLVEFLDGALSSQNEQELIGHLNDCTDCAQQLEQLAAESSRWHDVRSHLSRSRNVATLPPELFSQPDNLPFTIRQTLNMLDPTDDPNSMGRLGNYEVVGVVGSGAMGVVLKSFDQTLDRIVALKVMNPTLAACGTARHRFAREAKAAAGVLHPNVIAIHGVSTDRELPYLVMPYIAGTSLQQRMDRQGPLELLETLRIGSQIASGLAAAHRKGLIHRDIKPSNVMLDEGVETAMITDFGLARTIDDATMTRTGAITGTPEYMSPEQARGDTVDCASDVFSLGSVLYALCSGNRPFRAKTSFGVLRKITDQQPTPIREINPDTPVWLCRLIERMHSKNPAGRPSSADVRDLLENCLAHVYQPEKIPLPKELTDNDPHRVSLITKTAFLTGAFVFMTIITISILAAVIQSGSVSPDTPNESVTASQPGVIEPTIFKTVQRMFPKLGQRGTLKVDIQRGFIEVIGHDEPGVVIDILTPPEFEKPNQPGTKRAKFFAPNYDLDVENERNLIEFDAYNQNYDLNLRIKVPRKTDLDLDAYIDGLSVKNVDGKIKTRSEHGPVRLLDIAGTAEARSRNGDVIVRFVNVDVDAKLDFESYNGKIDLTFPKNTEIFSAISSGIGAFESDFAIEPIGDNERPPSILTKIKRNVDEYQFGKINGGGIPLRVENENGQIQIRKEAD